MLAGMMKFLGCVASASGRTVCPGLTGSIQGFCPLPES